MINIEGEQTQIRVGAWRPMFFLEVAKIYNVLGGAIATPKRRTLKNPHRALSA